MIYPGRIFWERMEGAKDIKTPRCRPSRKKRSGVVVEGGDTLSAISHEEDLEKITHISTGGGAMLELIEKGDLPGVEALRR